MNREVWTDHGTEKRHVRHLLPIPTRQVSSKICIGHVPTKGKGEDWIRVAHHWYPNASDRTPTTDQLYHHLAIFARPNAAKQLFYCAKYLRVKMAFVSSRVSIILLFEPLLNADNTQS